MKDQFGTDSLATVSGLTAGNASPSHKARELLSLFRNIIDALESNVLTTRCFLAGAAVICIVICFSEIVTLTATELALQPFTGGTNMGRKRRWLCDSLLSQNV